MQHLHNDRGRCVAQFRQTHVFRSKHIHCSAPRGDVSRATILIFINRNEHIPGKPRVLVQQGKCHEPRESVSRQPPVGTSGSLSKPATPCPSSRCLPATGVRSAGRIHRRLAAALKPQLLSAWGILKRRHPGIFQFTTTHRRLQFVTAAGRLLVLVLLCGGLGVLLAGCSILRLAGRAETPLLFLL
jgi:hypothetical protein